MHSRILILLLLVPILSFPLAGKAQKQVLPWLQNIDPDGRIDTIHTISTKAEVSVSDGLKYSVNTVFHDKQRAIFQRMYEDRTISQGIEGKYIWEYDGSVEREASPSVEGFVRGHQVHAWILHFDKMLAIPDTPQTSTFNGLECHVLAGQNENSSYRFFYGKSCLPLGMAIDRTGESDIQFSFSDWRGVSGIHLPYMVVIDDGSRKFHYRYQDVALNEGSLDPFRAPESILTDEQKLMRRHRTIMDGHLFGRAQHIDAFQADSMYIVSAGEIYLVEGRTPDASLDRILSNRNYTIYDDLIRPVIRISKDGTLGWVIVQVYAKGVRLDEDGNPGAPLEFTCSWIELYEKVEGDWRMKGNVSNFRSE